MSATSTRSTAIQIEKLLDNDCVAPTISIAGRAKSLPSNIGLEVTGRRISTPINNDEAEFIKSVARPSPHGQGQRTVIDDNVRKSFQIEPEKIQFKNPKFQSGLVSVVSKKKQTMVSLFFSTFLLNCRKI